MKSSINFIAGLLMIASTAGLAQESDRSSAEKSIDVTHVSIDLQFDWKNRQAFGNTVINLTVLQSINIVFLDAAKLDVHRISVINGKALNFKADENNDVILIYLDKTYGANDNLVLRVEYHTRYVNEYDPGQPGGSFGKGLRFFQPTESNPIKRQQIWSQGEPDGNHYWFPSAGQLGDLRTTEFIATVDKPLSVISNGNLTELKDNAGSTRTFHYQTDTPYASYLTAFVVGEFTELTQQYQGIPMHTFCYPDETQAAIATTNRLPDMMKFLWENTGMTYPFKRYSQVMVQNYPFPGLTGQHMVSIISDNMIDDHGTHADFLYLWDGVEFNALASQWFGNVITPAQWSDTWLTKSFAQYFEGLYTDQKNGHEEYLLWYHPFETGSIFNDWDAGNRHPVVPSQYENLENFTNDSYAKFYGALVLRMLRNELGDENFFHAVRHFIKNHAFKPVTTKDFQNSIHESSGKDLKWFFDQWIYYSGHPVFEFSKQYDAKKKQLKLTVRQVQPADTITGVTQYYQGKVIVEIDDRLEVIRLDAKRENQFVFSQAQPPHLVQFDFENTWIKELRTEKTFDELIFQFEHDRDITGRQSAMMELVTIGRDSATSKAKVDRVHDAFYQVINSKVYWRMRVMAINQWRTILPLPYDKKTTDLLLKIIQEEKSWLRATAVGMLGMTANLQYADVYLPLLADSSDRVINAAAIALGKSKSPKAFDALVKLKERPSWKGQSLMSCLNGLAQLKDFRAMDIALNALKDNRSPRWFLGNGWDYPLVAAQTLAILGKGQEAYPLILEQLRNAIKEKQQDDVFEKILLLSALQDPRALEVFDSLIEQFRENPSALSALENHKASLKTSLQK